MINVQWVETLPNGKKTIKYKDFLTDMFVEEFVQELKEKGCTDINVVEI